MAKQTSSKPSGGTTKKKATSEAPAPAAVTKTILKAEPAAAVDGLRVEAGPRAAPTHEQIAQRAFELYQQRSFYEGGALHDWLAAERELGA